MINHTQRRAIAARREAIRTTLHMAALCAVIAPVLGAMAYGGYLQYKAESAARAAAIHCQLSTVCYPHTTR